MEKVWHAARQHYGGAELYEENSPDRQEKWRTCATSKYAPIRVEDRGEAKLKTRSTHHLPIGGPDPSVATRIKEHPQEQHSCDRRRQQGQRAGEQGARRFVRPTNSDNSSA